MGPQWLYNFNGQSSNYSQWSFLIWIWSNTVVSNHVNFDNVPSFSWLDIWTNRQATSGVYALTVTSAYHSRRCGRLQVIVTFDPQLKKFLTFSVKDRHQLTYFICIKDFNAATNTSLTLKLFSLFICSCQHHQRKTICLYVYISDIRQIVGYRTPVFIQRFPYDHF
jgi:hypothetical protein